MAPDGADCVELALAVVRWRAFWSACTASLLVALNCLPCAQQVQELTAARERAALEREAAAAEMRQLRQEAEEQRQASAAAAAEAARLREQLAAERQQVEERGAEVSQLRQQLLQQVAGGGNGAGQVAGQLWCRP